MTMTRASSEAVSNESRRGRGAIRRRGHSSRGWTGVKEELGKWLESRRLPTQKMALEVNLAEGRGLVATEEIARGEAVLGVNRGTIITVRESSEERLGRSTPSCSGAFWRRFWRSRRWRWSVGRAGTFGEYIRALPRRTRSVLDWPEDEVDKLLAGSPSRLAAAEGQESVNAAIDEIQSYFQKSPSGRCDGRSTFYSVV